MFVGDLANKAVVMRDVMRTKPSKNPAMGAEQVLADALDKRIDKLSPGTSVNYALEANSPDFSTEKSTRQAFQDVNLGKYGQHLQSFNRDTGEIISDSINYNPNTPREILAHEMGHIASSRSDIGSKVRQLRNKLQANPKLATALGAAMFGIPMVHSSLQQGDDDMLENIAFATAVSAPTLVDEALATKNAFAILDDAGMRADLGQRGRLAGAYLTYLARPIMAGMGANLVGNIADDYTGLYDL